MNCNSIILILLIFNLLILQTIFEILLGGVSIVDEFFNGELNDDLVDVFSFELLSLLRSASTC